MPDSLPQMPSKGPLTTERRQSPRHPVRPTEYIEIGDSNGGIILDISEGGMAVASAQALVGNQTLLFRFQLPRTNETIETSGEINWIGETKKRAGVRFVDLPLAARKQIQKWIDSEVSGHTNDDNKPNGSTVASPSPKIPQEFPRRHFVHQEFPREKTTTAHTPNPPKNLNPFSSVLSSPLDEPEVEESEPQDEEKTVAGANAEPPPERRARRRLPMTASTYVQLNDGNGGLMTNVSKTGFCIRAAKILESDQLPVVRFQLPDTRDFVESSAWIVWKSPSKKMVGARFENLSDEAQAQIAQWIDSQPLPKTVSIKNPLSKTQLSPNPLANSPLEQHEKISPMPKTPAPVTTVPITLMAADSVPLPAYISPLAISLDAQPAPPSANNLSSALSQPPLAVKVPPIAPTKASPPTSEKTLAPVPAIIPAPSSTKPAPVASAPVLLQSQKPLSAPLSNRATVTPVELNNKAPNLASPPAFVPPVVPPPNPSLPRGKSLSVGPFPDISRGSKNPWDQLAAAPTQSAPLAPTLPVAPVFTQPDWSVAPKRPTGNWKIAAIIVVIVGTLLGAATLFRSKKPVTPVSQETTQNSSAAPTVPEATSSANPNSTPAIQPTASTTASASNSKSSREFYDQPRNTTPSKSSPKGDEQFVDEPRPTRSQTQISNPPIQSSASDSRSADEQPSASAPTSIQSGAERNQDQPVEQNSGFPEVVHHVQTTPTGLSNANAQRVAAADSSSPSPAPSASRNQQPDANLASVAGVTENSSTRPADTQDNNSSQRTTSASTNPSPASASSPASSTAAIPNPVPTVSVFSRFRTIRNTSDAARPAGSDLQIGRLKSGPAPPYPIEAQRLQIQGTVELEVLVGADGNILTVHLVKGPPELASVAMGTVRSWQYGQTTLGGHPVETDQSIYFTFKLTK
jgi:outer membrane biosynthesis protein TonB/c-di-GMP-binding flagellar brake protein YcgR